MTVDVACQDPVHDNTLFNLSKGICSILEIKKDAIGCLFGFLFKAIVQVFAFLSDSCSYSWFYASVD